MTDDLEPRLHDWLAERGRVTSTEVRAFAERTATLPARRASSAWLPLAAAAVVVAAVVALGTVLPPFTGTGGALGSPSASVPLPPDPAAFAGDRRLVRCGVPPARAIYAFELPRARDYRSVLPRMGESPELDVDDPAFVVVYEGAQPFGLGGGAGPSATNQPGNRDVCVLVGADPTDATLSVYGDVDIRDFSLTADGPDPTASPASTMGAAPPDPRAFEADPRLAACGATVASALYAIDIGWTDDLPRYLPAAKLPMELPVDELAFVVVFRDPQPYDAASPPIDAAPSDVPLTEAHREICVLVGTGFRDWEVFRFTGVDTTGLSATPADRPPASPVVVATPAPSPLPDWYSIPSAALECDGAVDRGPAQIDLAVVDPPEDPIDRLIALGWNVALPAAGYDAPERVGNVLGYRYRVDGRIKAIVLIREATVSSGHVVLAAPHCDPSEFDPADGLTGSPGRWVDETGTVPSSDVLEQRDDCYFGTWIRYEGRQFVRDPLGYAYDPGALLTTYEHDASLPPDAIDTGYRAGARQLHVAADGSAAYVVVGERTERWPRVRGDDYQRTDCN